MLKKMYRQNRESGLCNDFPMRCQISHGKVEENHLTEKLNKSNETHDEEESTDEDSLGAHVHIHREGNTKVISVGEALGTQPPPLLRDPGHLLGAVFAQHLQAESRSSNKLNSNSFSKQYMFITPTGDAVHFQ